MTKALPIDLREQVVAAISDGASSYHVAARFGVSASSALRWHALSKLTGNVSPKPQGGDRRSARIEAHAILILAILEAKPGITLAGIRTELGQHGISISVAGLWQFLKRRRITFQKLPGMASRWIA